MEHFSYKDGSVVWPAYMNIHISRSLKQELALATDKWLQVITITMLFKTVISRE